MQADTHGVAALGKGIRAGRPRCPGEDRVGSREGIDPFLSVTILIAVLRARNPQPSVDSGNGEVALPVKIRDSWNAAALLAFKGPDSFGG